MRRFVSLALLLGACRPEVTAPTPPPQDDAPPALELKRPDGVVVELLLAGKPPQEALVRSLETRTDTRSMFLGWRRYGAGENAKRDVTGELELRVAAQQGGGSASFAFVLREGSVEAATVRTTLGPWGPQEPIAQTEGGEGLGAEALSAAAAALLVPWPQRPVGEGAIWRIESPVDSETVERTTVEIVRRYSDGMELMVKSAQVLIDQPSPVDAKAETKAHERRPSGNTASWSATLWLHDDQVLPVRAFGQYRRSRDTNGEIVTDFVDWSLDP